jgi:F-type H+-transporting ATPase subunit alpha
MVFAASGDIAAYLPTNVMSITDGQWILDMKIFRDTMRPAVNAGLSVSRVGGRGQSKRQQNQAGALFKAITAHHTAQEFARFGSELAVSAQTDLVRGELIYKLLNQIPGETYNFKEQTLMLDVALNFTVEEQINVEKLKKTVREVAVKLKDDDSNFDELRDELKKASLISVATKPTPKPVEAPAPADGKDDKKDGDKDKKDKEEHKDDKPKEGDHK